MGINEACTAQREPPREGGVYSIGLDWGRETEPTDVVIIDIEHSRVVDVEQYRYTGWTEQKDSLRRLDHLWNPRSVWTESNSIGRVNIEALWAAGIPARPLTLTKNSILPLLNSLGWAIAQGHFSLLDHAELRRQFNGFTVEHSPFGFKYQTGPGQRNGLVIATMMAWYGCQHSFLKVDFV